MQNRYIVVQKKSQAITGSTLANDMTFNMSDVFPYHEAKVWKCKLEKCILTTTAVARYFDTDFIRVCSSLGRGYIVDTAQAEPTVSLFNNDTKDKDGTVSIVESIARSQSTDSWDFMVFRNATQWGQVKVQLFDDAGVLLLEDSGGAGPNDVLLVWSFEAYDVAEDYTLKSVF